MLICFGILYFVKLLNKINRNTFKSTHLTKQNNQQGKVVSQISQMKGCTCSASLEIVAEIVHFVQRNMEQVQELLVRIKITPPCHKVNDDGGGGDLELVRGDNV